MVGEQVMKGVEELLGIFEVGKVGTWAFLRVKRIASARKVSYKRIMPKEC